MVQDDGADPFRRWPAAARDAVARIAAGVENVVRLLAPGTGSGTGLAPLDEQGARVHGCLLYASRCVYATASSRVDFPAPEPPTNATVVPVAIRAETFVSTGSEASG